MKSPSGISGLQWLGCMLIPPKILTLKIQSSCVYTALVAQEVWIHHCMCGSNADLLIIIVPSNAHTDMAI